jgi:5-methylcytosine-specific restriction protein A
VTSYLITWKPSGENKDKGWPEEAFVELYKRFQHSGQALEPWRFSRRSGVEIGERIFLSRQGKRGAAILGYGTVSDVNHATRGLTTISFDALLDPRTGRVFATRDELFRITPKRSIWGTMSSGIALPADVADALERLVVGRTPIPDLSPSEKDSSHPWTSAELEAAVTAYISMRQQHLDGQRYSKARYYNDLARRFHRTAKAFEYRMQNISHVLSLMGRDWIPGLVPARNVGPQIASQIEQLIQKVEGRPAAPAVAFERELAELMASPPQAPPVGSTAPSTTTVAVAAFQRDPRVAAWVLTQSEGRCECCGHPAPFEKDDGTPFLEIHHLIRLADGGSDTVTNAIAICPNCHREMHYGKRRKEILENVRSAVPRLTRTTEN